ncbi:hypothetical protein Pmani_024685 [Petrolisthes manimaculis]|uniref:Uncharacterized protein n=1 Tax=Petrolisthes manimaculis TaxID=1843537 RepID=A0AAE1P8R5_9EUCA|nr:hypothetical protein Pmani_024685 [Petrolisthes manimaculis]
MLQGSDMFGIDKDDKQLTIDQFRPSFLWNPSSTTHKWLPGIASAPTNCSYKINKNHKEEGSKNSIRMRNKICIFIYIKEQK